MALEITLDADVGAITLSNGEEVCRIVVAGDILSRAHRHGPDAALALLANAATGHGLGILEAAARTRAPVALDGVSVASGALRAALSRPRYVL